MTTPQRPQPDSFEQLHEEPPDAYHPPTLEQLVQQMRETADKLLRDQATRGDIKLLNTALKELRYAFKIFSVYRNLRKVTVFGSARLPTSHPAYQQAVLFGEKIAAAGYMVITGAAAGIMEAGHVGAGRDKSIGVNILLPFEQEANPVIRGDLKLMHLRYFFTRKLLFIKEADAVVLFPGGFGTLDEGFEALTLVQTGKSQLLPIVLVDEPGGTYWSHFEQFIRETLLKNALISPSDLYLFRRTDSVDKAIEEVLEFYRVYHSMRYVRGGRLVLRLQRELSEPLLEKIRTEFADILASGTFEQMDALPEEANDAHVVNLKRLKFHFDRKNVGRLRQLVDVINREG
jgi:uncharacterized protein (TIGR00730 family)